MTLVISSDISISPEHAVPVDLVIGAVAVMSELRVMRTDALVHTHVLAHLSHQPLLDLRHVQAGLQTVQVTSLSAASC